MFASMHTAYAALSEGMQTMLRTVRTYDRYNKSAKRTGSMASKIPDKEVEADGGHPVVRLHPETKRPGLYVNDLENTPRLDGWTEDESVRSSSSYWPTPPSRNLPGAVKWKPRHWDNRQVLHMALNDYTASTRCIGSPFKVTCRLVTKG